MHFQVQEGQQADLQHPKGRGVFGWLLVKADGPVARSATTFLTEKEARSDIAAAKRSMRAAGRCRVLSPDEDPS